MAKAVERFFVLEVLEAVRGRGDEEGKQFACTAGAKGGVDIRSRARLQAH